jgi:hypothetical protein
MAVKPISPKEAQRKKISSIPDEVFESFNELIAEKIRDGEAVVRQCDVVERICAKMNCTKDLIFDKHWLDVEPRYEKEGWFVDYDKPAYCETYEATFTFKEKRLRNRLDRVRDTLDGI